MEMSLEELAQGFLLDTNVLILQPLAPLICANAWGIVEEYDSGQELVASLKGKGKELKNKPNAVVILDLITKELDDLMHGHDEHLKHLASRARSILADIRDMGQEAVTESASVVKLSNEGLVYFVQHDEESFQRQQRYDPRVDDRLVWNFKQIFAANILRDVRFQFVSQDVIARGKCRDTIAGVLLGYPNQVELTQNCAAEFEAEHASEDPHQQYTGIARLVPNKDLQEILENALLTPPPEPLTKLELKPNQFIEVSGILQKIIKQDGPNLYARKLANYDRFRQFIESHVPRSPTNVTIPAIKKLKPNQLYRMIDRSGLPPEQKGRIADIVAQNRGNLIEAYSEVMRALREAREAQTTGQLITQGFNKNLIPVEEQVYALEILNDPAIPVVSIIGHQGSGKTLWATYSGIVQVAQGLYPGGMLYFKPLVGTDKGVGYLKGSFEAKVAPWVQPCKDALLEIFGAHDEKPGGKQRILNELTRLEAHNVIQYEIATWQAGRTWRNMYVIIDEAHLFTREEARLLIGRIGQGTKVVLLGDPSQIGSTQKVTHWYLNERNNGLSHVVERLQGNPLYAHVTFSSQEVVRRSDAAKLARLL